VLRGNRALGTQLLQHPLSGAQIDLLNNPRLALDAGRAHPIEVRFVFFPLVTRLDIIVEGYYVVGKYSRTT